MTNQPLSPAAQAVLNAALDEFISQCRPLDPEIAAELTPDVMWRLYDDSGAPTPTSENTSTGDQHD